MNRVYLDTSCLIYVMEGGGAVRALLTERLDEVLTNPDGVLFTSRLSRLECRTKPLRDQNVALLRQYDDVFGAARFTLMEVTAAVIERATFLRARYRFKTPDAIHVSTAIEARVDLLLTGDATLARCVEVSVEVVAPTGSPART